MPSQDEDLKTLVSRLPPRHRLLIKLLMRIPVPSMPFIIVTKLPLLEGVLHGIALPVFVFLIGIFTYWLIPTATIMFGFPLNVAMILVVIAFPFALFVRVELDKSIRWWKSSFGSSIHWDTSKTTEELVELFKKQQRKTTKSRP